MVLSAAALLREYGANATSIDRVLAHSGAPRGSVYHHFPGGRAQLIEEAVALAGAFISGLIETATRTDDPLDAVEPPTAAAPVLQAGSPPIGAAPSAFLEAKAVAAAALPIPKDTIADPQAKVNTLRTAADQYTFIQERLAAWQAAGQPGLSV
jgi:AcrR family transcriptional regulator